MSLTCPKCASSGEFLRYNDDYEVRKCRICGYEYEVQIDVDDDPYPPEEPYSQEDIGYGTCPECGSGLYNGGAVSDGDGDLYDELICPLCQEPRGKANQVWIDDEGNRFHDEDEYYALGSFDDTESANRTDNF